MSKHLSRSFFGFISWNARNRSLAHHVSRGAMVLLLLAATPMFVVGQEAVPTLTSLGRDPDRVKRASGQDTITKKHQ